MTRSPKNSNYLYQERLNFKDVFGNDVVKRAPKHPNGKRGLLNDLNHQPFVLCKSTFRSVEVFCNLVFGLQTLFASAFGSYVD